MKDRQLRNRFGVVEALFVVSGLVFAGCGSSDSGTKDSSPRAAGGSGNTDGATDGAGGTRADSGVADVSSPPDAPATRDVDTEVGEDGTTDSAPDAPHATDDGTDTGQDADGGPDTAGWDTGGSETSGLDTSGPDSKTQTATPGDCSVVGVNDFGDCETFLGWANAGNHCAPISGCSCERYCDRIFETEDACLVTCFHLTACGGPLGDTCRADQYCDFKTGEACGDEGATAICRLRQKGCEAVYAPVCGCDGNSYANDCEAGAVGWGYRYEGTCRTAYDPDISCVTDTPALSRWTSARPRAILHTSKHY